MTRTDLNIGLFGFGVVGQGLHAVLARTPGLRARIGRVAVKNRDKPRAQPAELFTFDKNDLLSDPALTVIVELIDDADEAYRIVKEALLRGKAVVTANKKMLAELGEDYARAREELDLLEAIGADHDQKTFEEHETTPVLFGAALPNFGVATLLNVMETDDHQVGLETMCVAGGQGEAMIVERLS